MLMNSGFPIDGATPQNMHFNVLYLLDVLIVGEIAFEQ